MGSQLFILEYTVFLYVDIIEPPCHLYPTRHAADIKFAGSQHVISAKSYVSAALQRVRHESRSLCTSGLEAHSVRQWAAST